MLNKLTFKLTHLMSNALVRIKNSLNQEFEIRDLDPVGVSPVRLTLNILLLINWGEDSPLSC